MKTKHSPVIPWMQLFKSDEIGSCGKLQPMSARCLKCMVVVVPALTFASKLNAKFVENPAAPLEWEERQEILLLQALGANYLESHSNTTAVCEVIQCYTCETTWIPHAYVICADCCKGQGYGTTASFQNLCGQLWLICRAFLTKAPNARMPISQLFIEMSPVFQSWKPGANTPTVSTKIALQAADWSKNIPN